MSEFTEPDDAALEQLLAGRAAPPEALAPLLAALTSPGTADEARLTAALAAFEASRPDAGDTRPEVDDLEPHRRRRWAARSLVAALVAVAAALGASGVAIAAGTGHLRLPAIIHRPAPHPSRSVPPESTAPSTAPTASGSTSVSPSRSASASPTSSSAGPTATSSSAAPSSNATSATPTATASLVPSASVSVSVSSGPTTSHGRPTTKPTRTRTPAATASHGKSATAPGHTKTTAAGE